MKCSEILAHIKLLYNPTVNKVFTSLHVNLEMILQLKSMMIAMNPARIALSDCRNAMVCDMPYLQNEFGDPQFFYVFNPILSFSSSSQSFKKNLYVGSFGRERLQIIAYANHVYNGHNGEKFILLLMPGWLSKHFKGMAYVCVAS